MTITSGAEQMLRAEIPRYARALYQSGGNVARAAESLGVRRTTLVMRLTRARDAGIVDHDMVEVARQMEEYRRREEVRLVEEARLLRRVRDRYTGALLRQMEEVTV
jgi:DNA-binding transcriptional regulator LsrR (DeoR family)